MSASRAVLLVCAMLACCAPETPNSPPKLPAPRPIAAQHAPPPPPFPEYTRWPAAKRRAFIHDLVSRDFPDTSPYTKVVPSVHDLCGEFVHVGDSTSIPYIERTLKHLERHPEGCAAAHCQEALDLIRSRP